MNEVDTGRRKVLLAGAGAMAAPALGATAFAQSPDGDPPETEHVSGLELAFVVRAPSTPTGLAVGPGGRAFVFMPRFDERVPFSVGEVAGDGTVTPWPDADTNRPDPHRAGQTFFHVPNGVFDRTGRLWILDAGLLASTGEPVPGAAKLVAFDLRTGTPVRTIPLGDGVVSTSSLNDLRLRIGPDGPDAAFISDQGQAGEGAILAVDLGSGRVVRRLAGHPSTTSGRGLLKIVEGRPLRRRTRDGRSREVLGGANGIALGPGGRRLYYAPLMSRHLFAVDTGPLLDPGISEADLGRRVADLGEKGLTGGLLCDDRDRVYLTLQEHNAVGRRDPDGTIEIVGSDPRLIWPDTLWITADNYLYVSSAQVNRRPEFNGGTNRQDPPYAIFRRRIDAGPA